MINHSDSVGKKDLYVAPICGIGNRMLAILTALYYKYGDDKYSNASVLWARDLEFCLNHSELLKADIDFINLIGIYKSYKYEDKSHDQVIYEHNTHYYVKACNIFKNDNRKNVLNWIRSRSRYYYDLTTKPAKIPDNSIGLHCRRSDYGINIKGKVASDEQIMDAHIALDIQFANIIDSMYKTEPLFICTDSAYTLAYFKNRFGDRLNYLPKSQYPKYSNRNETILREAILDFSTLSNCKLIHRDSNSTFSFAASLIKNAKLRTWNRPVLKTCGATIINEEDTNNRR